VIVEIGRSGDLVIGIASEIPTLSLPKGREPYNGEELSASEVVIDCLGLSVERE
jgi:hypothetical protein